MRFLLTFDDGQQAVFDNHNQSLTNTDGYSIIELSEPVSLLGALKVSPETPVQKHRSVNKLRIQLGLKCNYSCDYCLQSAKIPEAAVTNKAEAQAFIDTLPKWLDQPPTQIEFWGGEPLVYWSRIKDMLPALRKYAPQVHYHFHTNGALLSEEVLAYVEEYNIHLTLSHDGPGQRIRGEDPLDNPETYALIRKLVTERNNMFSISAVLTGEHPNPLKVIDWFEAKGLGDAVIGFEGPVASYDGKVLPFTTEAYEEMHTAIVEGAKDGTLWRSGFFFSQVDQIMQVIQSRQTSDTFWSKCGMDRPDMMAVDLRGNILTCQNTGGNSEHNIGNLFTPEGGNLNTAWHWAHRRECPTCPVLAFCRGSCMMLEPDSKEWAATCDNHFYWFMGLFTAALYQLTGRTLVEIAGEEEIKRPQLIPIIPVNE